MTKARVLNREALEAKFRELPDHALVHVRLAIAKGAAEVDEAARALAPQRTGKLKRSITHQIREDGLQALVGTNVPYARHVEFGTRPSTKGQRMAVGKGTKASRRTHPGTEAQPFLFPAYRIMSKRVKGRIRRGLKKAFKEATKSSAVAVRDER